MVHLIIYQQKPVVGTIEVLHDDRRILRIMTVNVQLQLLADKDMSLVMTTHYDIEPGSARCLKVKGFENGSMNYQLVEVQDGEVPHEALNIAQSLGIDSEWITIARNLLETFGKTE